MIELIRTDDAVLVSWLQWHLAEAGVPVHVFDVYTSGLYGGALLAIQQRVMVEASDLPRARQLLLELRNHAAEAHK